MKKRGRLLVERSSVAAAALATGLVVAANGSLSVVAPLASLDIRHLQEMDRRVAGLFSEPNPRILFLGNSLTKCGIAPEVVREAFRNASGLRPSITVVHPDDSTIADWYYIVRRDLAARGRWPEMLVIPFANRHLTDQSPVDPRRLGAWMGGMLFAREAFRDDVTTTGERSIYLLSAFSSLFADAERVRNEVFAYSIPYYRSTAQILNRSLQESPGIEGRETAQTYRRLERLLDVIPRSRVKVFFVAAPLPRPFALPEGLSAAVAARGAALVDLRVVRGIGPASFPDGYHLNSEGAAILSKDLGERLGQMQ